MKRIVVLASGRGSNFEALACAIESKKIPNAQIVGLLCNKKDALVFQKAKAHGIPAYLIESDRFRKASGKLDRNAYEKELLRELENLSPDLICLAGYLLLLGSELVRRYPLRIVNIHPSLLPAFKGLRAQKQALDAGEKTTGCTVHFVNEELDGGPLIAQSSLEILPEDNEDSLSERLLPLEHATYVEALRKLCTRSYEIRGNRVVFSGEE